MKRAFNFFSEENRSTNFGIRSQSLVKVKAHHFKIVFFPLQQSNKRRLRETHFASGDEPFKPSTGWL